MNSTRLHSLTIADTRNLPDGIAISLAIPDELRMQFEHEPGQYLTVEATINGEKARRSYSICSYHKDRNIEIGIKRIDNGVFSNYALGLSAGDKLDVMPPEGRFVTHINEHNRHHYLLIAAGSGITPCLSIAKSVLKDELNSRVTLLFGNRTISSIMFRNDIAALKDVYTKRFNVINMLSGERQDIEKFNGRISADVITTMAQTKLLQPSDYHSAYLCGPLDMVNEASAALRSLGMKDEQIFKELFTSGSTPLPTPPPAAGGSTARETDGIQVTIMLDGSQTDITVDPSKDTILAAAQKAGIDMPFSCAGGMCCTCRCKIIEGSTSMDANFSLADWEIEKGYTLACQSRPTSDKLVLDFDAS